MRVLLAPTLASLFDTRNCCEYLQPRPVCLPLDRYTIPPLSIGGSYLARVYSTVLPSLQSLKDCVGRSKYFESGVKVGRYLALQASFSILGSERILHSRTYVAELQGPALVRSHDYQFRNTKPFADKSNFADESGVSFPVYISVGTELPVASHNVYSTRVRMIPQIRQSRKLPHFGILSRPC
jgi:hypothetical protein